MSILLWIQADSRWRLLKSTPQPPCSACRHRDDVDAAGLQSVRAGGGSGDIFTNRDLFVMHCDNLRYIVLQICITQIPGEYIINFISLLIISSLSTV